jgi:HlyD family secretion protein
VEVGDKVKKGRPLAALDSSDFALGVKQAEAAYHSAKVAHEIAEKDYARVVNLKAEGSIAPSDFEKAELGYKSAKYGMEQAEAMYEYARNRLNSAVIRAPFDGQITQRLVMLGSYVDAMTHPVLFIIVDNSRLKAAMNIPESRAAMIKEGDEVRLHFPSHQRDIAAKIDVITDSVDAFSHTRTAIAWIQNTSEDPLPSGIFFEAKILPSNLAGKILLPSSCVRVESDGKTYAYVIRNNKAARTQISGSFIADYSEFLVAGGVSADDRIVAESSMVRDGQPVIASGSDKPAAATASEGGK